MRLSAGSILADVRDSTARAGLRGHRLTALAGAALAYFMVQFGMVPVAVVLPTVANEFHVDMAHAGWAMTSYLLMLAALALPAGRLGDVLGLHKVFLAGVVVFGVATVLTGLAGSMEQFIALRALQGAGGALLLGTTLAITASVVPESQRGRALASTAIAASVSGMVGSVGAGLAVTYLSWRWLFFLVLPLAALTAKLGVDMLRAAPVASATKGKRMDILGAVLFSVMLATLVMSFNHFHDGPETFEAGFAYHTTLQVVTAVLFVVLLIVESRVQNPLLVLPNFRNGLFSAAVAANVVVHMTMASMFFLLPFVIQRGMVLPALYISAALVSRQVLDISAPALAGWLYDKTRSPLLRPVSMALISVSMLAMAILSTDLSYVTLVVLTVFAGFGSGAFITTNNTVLLSALPLSERGFSGGMLETTRQLGHTIAVALVAAVVAVVLNGADGVNASPRMYLEAFRSACFVVAGVSATGVVVASLGVRRRTAAAQSPQPAVVAGARSPD